jgi:hypothetical protein
VAAAYARSDLFDKRFALMRDWAAYCATNRATSPKAPADVQQTAAVTSEDAE